ncbi:hypothetical protein DH2020_026968 [Rehmannia glutinosa]|uniref:CCHC-type domain-containing protein n=1 Tax=Rehmannia glutinosa TaxID=99300 RepID=A0ABR0VYD2_REHGL
MESEITSRLLKFNLGETEKVGVRLEEEDVAQSKEECRNSLFGKVFGTKRANFTGLKTTMGTAWPIQNSFSLKELGFNTFQFVFRSESDKNKILKGNIWSFDGQYLLLKEWSEDVLEQLNGGNFVDLWIQVWNLPLEWISMETGFKIGKLFSKIHDVIIPESGSSKGIFLKILATVNLDKPLLRGTHIALGNISQWVEFRYENLLTFCFYCGHVEHLERACDKRKEDIQTDSFLGGQFGEWLRAGEYGTGNKKGRQYAGKKEEGIETVKSQQHNVCPENARGPDTSNEERESPVESVVDKNERIREKQQLRGECSSKVFTAANLKMEGSLGGQESQAICENVENKENQDLNLVNRNCMEVDKGFDFNVMESIIRSQDGEKRVPLQLIRNNTIKMNTQAETIKRGRKNARKTLSVVRVCELLENDGKAWKEELVMEMFTPNDAEIILKIPLLSPGDKDRLRWHHTAKGNFTVSSAYSAVQQYRRLLKGDPGTSDGNKATKTLWKTTWKLNIKNKMKHFIWRCVYSLLPSAANLCSKGLKIDEICFSCGNEEVCTMTKTQFAHDRISLSVYILWWLWKTRNLWRFQNVLMPEKEIVEFATKEWLEYNSVRSKDDQHFKNPGIYHTSPYLNPDVAKDVGQFYILVSVQVQLNKEAGWGIVVKNTEGNIIKSWYTSRDCGGSPVEVLLLAIREGQLMAYKEKWKRIIFLLEDESLVTILNGGQCSALESSSTAEDIFLFKNLFDCCLFQLSDNLCNLDSFNYANIA